VDELSRLPVAGESASHDVLRARSIAIAQALSLEDGALPPPDARSTWATALLAALALALLGVAYAPTFVWMWERWEDAHGYYGHGPVVVAVVAWLVWRDRARLVPAPGTSGTRAGLALLSVGGLLHVVSAALENVHFLSGGSLLLVLAGAAHLLGGRAFARKLAFPIAFLSFAVPLPMLAVAKLSLELKLLAARLAIGALSVAGLPAVREGSIVHLAAGDVTVDDVCSGMRSLVSLLALGALVAGLEPARGPRRFLVLGALLGLSVPIAIVANSVRIAFLCGIVEARGPAILDTWVHDASGFVVFGVALALLLCVKASISGSAAEGEAAPPAGPGHAPGVGRVALACALLVPSATATLAFDRAGRASGPPVGAGLPLELGAWTGEDLPIEKYVREVLETNDLISRSYTRAGADPVFLYVAASRGDRKVAHPPDVCLSGNGFLIEGRREIELARDVHGDVRAVELVLVRGSEEEVVVYFYAAGERLGPSYLALQLAGAWERLFDPDVASALVRFSARVDGRTQTRESALASIRDLARDLVPELRRRLREKGS
jgi:EpsI family protein